MTLSILCKILCVGALGSTILGFSNFGGLNYRKSTFLGHDVLRMSAPHDSLEVDVAIIGGGIAGSSISWLLQEREMCSVALIDPRVNTPGTWYPNYGEWRSEWHHLSDRLKLPELKECTTTEWEITDCFFGGSFDMPKDERTTLPRPYVRVDRIKMQSLLRSRFAAAGGVTIASKLTSSRMSPNLFDKNLVHHAEGTTLTLDNGSKVKCKVLIDATGTKQQQKILNFTALNQFQSSLF